MTESKIPTPGQFLECQLHPVSTREFIDIVTASEPPPRKITYLNAHCSNLAARNSEYCDAVNRCDLVYADGQSVVWAARHLGAQLPERVNAGDFILDFCRACAEKGLSLYLLGGAEGVAQGAAKAWETAVPDLRIVGVRHGYFKPEEEEAIAEEIREASPDVILIGMSAPRQELWMDRWADRIETPIFWCVGALFEYDSGLRARAPRWMRRTGLEWLFRLILEPRRLWKRYLVGNAVFIRRVLKKR